MKKITPEHVLLFFLAYRFPRFFANICFLITLLIVTTILRFEFGFSETTAIIISLTFWFFDLLIIIVDILYERKHRQHKGDNHNGQGQR